MASELPQRRARVGGARTQPPAAPRGLREFEALEPLDDPLLERVLDGLGRTSAAQPRGDVRSA